jgi:C4-dicarboxylate transporter, DctQ subunit
MLKLIDTLSDWCGRLAAWLFFLIGIIIVFEVIARYVFLAPTIWSEEMSRFLQIWATYLAAAHVLRNRQLIAIDLVVRSLSPLLRTCCEALALLVIIAFSLVAVVYGTEIVVDSLRVGRSTATMLSVPFWMSEIAIPIGFGLLLLQALAELFRTVTGTATLSGSHHLPESK